MANALYNKAREGFLNGDIDWISDDIKAVLVDNTYTPNLNSHQYLSSIAAPKRMAFTSNFGGKTSTLGVADADDELISPGPGAGTIQYVVIYKDTGLDTTSPLIVVLDTCGGTGLPAAATGDDVSLVWDASGIFNL